MKFVHFCSVRCVQASIYIYAYLMILSTDTMIWKLNWKFNRVFNYKICYKPNRCKYRVYLSALEHWSPYCSSRSIAQQVETLRRALVNANNEKIRALLGMSLKRLSCQFTYIFYYFAKSINLRLFHHGTSANFFDCLNRFQSSDWMSGYVGFVHHIL